MHKYTNSMLGKEKRILKILGMNRGVVISPIDDSLIFGPEGGLEDIKRTVQSIIKGCPDAILGYRGAYVDTLKHEVPYIMNLTASTVHSFHTKKVIIENVEDAVCLGVDAIAVHVNISSRYEGDMLTQLGEILSQCNKWGMPSLLIIYPRQEGREGDNNYIHLKDEQPSEYTRLVSHCARIGYELGADIIKTNYTGSRESFFKVIQAACDIPVVIAGGPIIPEKELFTMTYDAMLAGGRGISYGRNVFQRKSPELILKVLRRIVKDNISPEQAMYEYDVSKCTQ